MPNANVPNASCEAASQKINISTLHLVVYSTFNSLQIMKIKKYFFFSTLVCIYLFLGGGVGLSTATSFFFLLQALIAYHMHAKVNFCI